MAYKRKLEFIDFELDNLKKENLYRRLRYGKVRGSKIAIENKTLLNLCSNDYLGISDTKIKQDQLQSSSRLVSGNDKSYFELEMIHFHLLKRGPTHFLFGVILSSSCQNCDFPYHKERQ